jgi:hypothetical protein
MIFCVSAPCVTRNRLALGLIGPQKGLGFLLTMLEKNGKAQDVQNALSRLLTKDLKKEIALPTQSTQVEKRGETLKLSRTTILPDSGIKQN